MEISLDDLRQQYSAFPNEVLLSMKREDLIPLAQQAYHTELAKRGRTNKRVSAGVTGQHVLQTRIRIG